MFATVIFQSKKKKKKKKERKRFKQSDHINYLARALVPLLNIKYYGKPWLRANLAEQVNVVCCEAA